MQKPFLLNKRLFPVSFSLFRQQGIQIYAGVFCTGYTRFGIINFFFHNNRFRGLFHINHKIPRPHHKIFFAGKIIFGIVHGVFEFAGKPVVGHRKSKFTGVG